MTNLTIVLAGIFIVSCCVILTKARMCSDRRAMNLPKQADCGEKEAEECAKNISIYLSSESLHLYIVRNLCTFTRNNFPY